MGQKRDGFLHPAGALTVREKTGLSAAPARPAEPLYPSNDPGEGRVPADWKSAASRPACSGHRPPLTPPRAMKKPTVSPAPARPAPSPEWLTEADWQSDRSGRLVRRERDAVPSRPKPPEEKRTDLIDLSDNRMNTDNFPFSIWAKFSRSILSGKSKELMEISPTNGKKELREAIAGHLKSFRGMLVDPNQIVVGAGTEYLYSLLIQLLGNDKTYCLENPGYTKIAKVYTKHQVTCHYVDLDDSGITLKGLRKAEADVVHISPNHHFPTGITMPVKRRYEVLSWANEKDGRYIIEDDYDSEFRISGKPIPTLFSIDESEKVIYMNTFSKSLTPTIRISYMVLPVHLANLFYESLSFYACTVSNFEQFILADFIKNGYFEKHINRMRLFYARKRRALIDAVKNSRLKDISEIMESDSGLHFLLKIDTEKTDADFSAQLQDKGIHVEFLSEFYHDKSNREHLMIINYSNFDVQTMGDIFDKIAEIAEK